MDAGLRLLDRQLIDSQGKLAGKVDDLELTPSRDDSEVLYVTAILAGPGALAGRLGGRLGHWPASPSRWSRRSAPRSDLWVPKSELETNRLEEWVREHATSKIPGAEHAPE
jgi:hypothetical protein